MPDPSAVSGTLLVTGANGHLGRKLLARCAGRRPVRAVVRSERAAATLRDSLGDACPEIRTLDYGDEAALAEAAAGCTQAVHLVGVIKETASTRFADAHPGTCRALAAAAAKATLERVVYLSIVGAAQGSPNDALRSKAEAEAVLLRAATPAVVLRVPMVLGEDDHASRALSGQARAGFLALPGGGSTWQQPIDANDVVAAILCALRGDDLADVVLDLAGPEALRHRDLVARVSAMLGRRPAHVLPVPLFPVRFAAGILERLSANPPISRAMLGVLQHDDRIDPAPACRRLGLELTPLDETLRRCVLSGGEKETAGGKEST